MNNLHTLKEHSISSFIYLIRGEKVMLDFDQAMLYGVENRALKQAVRRNSKRFPEDFMFVFTLSPEPLSLSSPHSSCLTPHTSRLALSFTVLCALCSVLCAFSLTPPTSHLLSSCLLLYLPCITELYRKTIGNALAHPRHILRYLPYLTYSL